MEPQEVQEYLSRRVFRLRIERNHEGMWEWGSGFFVSPRLAITAYHNIPKALRNRGGGRVTALYVDADDHAHDLTFEWMRHASDRGHDIAVLSLSDSPAAGLPYLRPAILPATLSQAQMRQYWAGRHVAVYGFPFGPVGNGSRFLVSTLDALQPLEDIPCTDPFTGENLTDPVSGKPATTLRLRLFSNNAYQLGGISGAPIFDIASESVVGVQHSYEAHLLQSGSSMVFGTPLCRLALTWPEFAAECEAVTVDPGFFAGVRRSSSGPKNSPELGRRIKLLQNLPSWKGTHQLLLGRDDESKALTDALLSPDCAVVCIIADGGFGKSALLKHWIESIRNKPSTESWMGLQAGFAYSFYKQGWEERSAPSSTPFFEECLSFLSDSQPDQLPAGGPARWAQEVLEVLRRRQALLVLDGLEPHQRPRGSDGEGRIIDRTLQEFVKGLVERPAGGFTVITSRVMPPELQGPPESARVRVIRLQPLRPEVSARVLEESGVRQGQARWAEACGGHPLLLALLAPAIAKGSYDINTFESHRVLTENGLNFPETIRHFVLSHLSSLDDMARAVLYSVCVFARPVHYDELCRLLLKRKSIPRFTQPLYIPSGLWRRREFSDKRFNSGVDDLVAAAMLTVDNKSQSALEWKFDVHPLVQAGIRSHLSQNEKELWRQANLAVYNSLTTSVPRMPDKREDLLQLYAAVPHGVEAGCGKRAGWMYALRCLHGYQGYSTNRHGMISEDLNILSYYFEGNWLTLREDMGLSDYDKVQAYGWTGGLLSSINRGHEGRPLLERGLTLAVETRNFTSAARISRTLSLEYALNGQLSDAEQYADRSIAFLEKTSRFLTRMVERKLINLAGQRMAAHTTRASILHYQGRFADANAAFGEAVKHGFTNRNRSQRRSQQRDLGRAEADGPLLRGIWCFREVEMLLDWGRFDEATHLIEKSLADPNQPPTEGEGVFSLPQPLRQLAFVRARIRRVDLTGGWRDVATINQYTQDFENFNAVDRRLRYGWVTPLIQIALAGVARLSGNTALALARIEEADRLVELSGDRLYSTDIQIERARIQLAAGRLDLAQQCLDRAASIAQEIGYLCKDQELLKLRAQMEGRP